MTKKYEATYILDIPGKEETVKEMIDFISDQVEKLGGKVSGTQKMDRHKFERVAGQLDAGYYLGVSLELDSVKVKELNTELERDKRVFRQFYLAGKAEKVAAAA